MGPGGLGPRPTPPTGPGGFGPRPTPPTGPGGFGPRPTPPTGPGGFGPLLPGMIVPPVSCLDNIQPYFFLAAAFFVVAAFFLAAGFLRISAASSRLNCFTTSGEIWRRSTSLPPAARTA